MNLGQIIISKCGRDKGRFFIVIEAEHDTVLVCDGSLRKMVKPKKKKIKHIQKTNFVSQLVDTKLRTKAVILDDDIQNEINSFTAKKQGIV